MTVIRRFITVKTIKTTIEKCLFINVYSNKTSKSQISTAKKFQLTLTISLLLSNLFDTFSTGENLA